MSGNLAVVGFEGELNSIVKEYLLFNTLEKSCLVFEKECNEKGKPISPTDGRAPTDQKLLSVQNEMLQSYRTGNHQPFLKLWNEYLPASFRNDDSVAQKLEFYLHIYFAIYPIKHGHTREEADANMVEFKQFIETRGSTLSQTTEFLPFYALPFVPNPKAHPSYKELFSDSWSEDLENRLDKFISLALKSAPQPRLFDLYRSAGGDDKNLHQENTILQQRVADAEKKTMTYIKRHNKVQADYHNLIGITADLVDALESTVQGHTISPEYLQQLCTRLFSAHMRTSVEFRPGTAGDVLRASVAPQMRPVTVAEYPPLDFVKIKKDLMSGVESKVALLLQALRWRLTRSRVDQRDAIVTAYINNDLLGCAKSGTQRETIQKLVTSDSEIVREYTARLFNAFASLSVGRTYLAQNPDLMPALMRILQGEDKESMTREMVLGALQKLSLRRALQSAMIDKGVIEWLVSVLEDNDSLSDYTLEYSVALLMNLCLRTSGKQRCSRIARQVLKVLSDLLGHENTDIRPYVNGALYSIFAIPSIRDEAKAMGMEEILKCFIKENQHDTNRQIEFIIKQLNSSENVDDVDSDDEEEEDDEEEDQDALEADIDKDEVVRPQPGELAGEGLLTRDYLGPPSTAKARRKHSDNALGQHRPLQRPVTPGQRRAADLSVYTAPAPMLPPVSRPSTGHKDLTARPPTRSGSRPSSQQTAQEVLSVRPASQSSDKSMRPSTKALENLGPNAELTQSLDCTLADEENNGNITIKLNIKEYKAAFGSRPRLMRTPDISGLKRPPSQRSSISKDPPPQPQFSESGPRPSSAGKTGSTSPRKASTSSQGSSGRPMKSRPPHK
ncbi:lisH domain-containing protein ARMC9-like isoform X2 [Gigantopelta aegis]|uniref:lisH domain-containing protein ARMC9-like isoform X2 n=1 Tax=Gigantopelta aegis TaxID=1735272 RepID=UPI001B887E45|nr:lisH domain-containing protein ARMC9-like isoform X2 [Gigantopelta aegis]